jgi:Domain of Unknown Function (DUF1080)
LRKLFTVTVLATLVLLGCGPREKKKQLVDPELPPVTPEEPLVKLSSAQKAEGWKILFDGRTLDGWRTFKNASNVSWNAVDGMLHSIPFDSRSRPERADLFSIDEFESFELSLDWKISPQSNTGIMFHVTEEFNEPYFSGPEYQIVDDIGYPGDLKAFNKTGGCYGMYVPINKKLHPVGEWNSSRLLVKGNHVEHWLNGTKVVDYDLNSPDWKKRKSASKWNDAKGYGVASRGHIDLQDHGDEVWFKNILIRSL